ncbi:GNAT family N-acetyltransferase [Lentzea sp. JNUCC 0626]|uniref:GNAT family N-acetyltransferase n=1 Tax=Lentzea sp. JNUCC 0626 TaxID=3367513 RepID=UPI0037489390
MTSAAALLSAFDTQARPAEWTTPDPGAEVHQDGPVYRVTWPRRRGFIAGPPTLGVEGTTLDTLIARQRDYFTTRNQGVEWKTWSHDTPADLPDRLLAAGFESEGQETVLVGLANELTTQPPLDGVVIREAKDESDIHKLAATATKVFGRPHDWLVDHLLEKQHDPNVVPVIAEANGEVVSSSRIEFVPGTEFAGLWGGGTLKAWRGKGIYRALIAHRARLAVARGTKYLQVDASEDSRPILERLGFTTITTTTGYAWTPKP